jgi:PAS domain S-box-containing protein
MLTWCNQILARAADEQELLKRVCEAIVGHGGYQFAWIGFAERDAASSVRPVAASGVDSAYLERVEISWADTPAGRGPTGRAIRDRSVAICRDISTDEAFAPWRAHARRYGYASSIALPLMLDGDCVGALNIYSALPSAFDAAEVELLRELANDVSFGLQALRTRERHFRAEEQLGRFRRLVDRTADMIYVVDATTGAVLDANETVSRQLGYSREELLRMQLKDFSITAGLQPWPTQVARARAHGSFVVEGEHRCKDGRVLPVQISLSYAEQDHTPYLISVTRDMTEQQAQRKLIDRMARMLRMQSAIASAVLRIRDRHELLRESCRLATQLGR